LALIHLEPENSAAVESLLFFKSSNEYIYRRIKPITIGRSKRCPLYL